MAIVARVVFLLGEADCLRTDTNESVLLPIGALLTSVGMLLLGSAVVLERAWHGWPRFGPLSMGVYPLLAMFPLAAATGEPPSAAIGGWAFTFVAVGIACVQASRARPLRAGSVRSSSASTEQAAPQKSASTNRVAENEGREVGG